MIMEAPKETIDVAKFEKRMLEEIRKWREQRAVMEKSAQEAFNVFAKEIGSSK
jgi:hypothetical protein